MKRLNPFDEVTTEFNLVDKKSEDVDKDSKTESYENDDSNNIDEVNKAEENIELLSPRQQRKHNFLNKAQEFAELKRLDSKVLPFDLHLHIDQTNSESQRVNSGAFCTMSTTMPPSVDSGKTGAQSPQSNINGHSVFNGTNLKPSDGASNEENLSKGNNCGDGIGNNVLKGSYSSADKINGGNSLICDTHNPESQHICDKKEGNSEKDFKGISSLCDTIKSNSCQDKETDKKVPVNSSNSGQTDDVVNAFDVYNIETALPDMDWSSLEEKLRAASEEARLIQEVSYFFSHKNRYRCF